MATPLVSIGLPVYNGENFLAMAIESVLDQSYSDFELIISDNSSTDSTEDICRYYAARDARIVYSRTDQNLGAAPNFNRCVSLTRDSAFFKWIAHDDLIDRRFVELCCTALLANPTAVLAFPSLIEIEGAGLELGRSSDNLALPEADPASRVRRLIDHEHRGTEIFWALFGLIRKSALLETRLHGRYIGADQVLLFELAVLGNWVFVPETSYARRAHPQSSAAVNRTSKTLLHWYDSSLTKGLSFRHWTLMGQHVAAVWHLKPERGVRRSLYTSIARRCIREWRNLAGDVRLALCALRESVRRRNKAL